MKFVLNVEELSELQHFLKERKWIAPVEEIQFASKPGEGNMNYVLRIRTNIRTFILKQSREYVEKYPHIPAPAERAVTEGIFYELIQQDELMRNYTPEITSIDEGANMIMLEDLGNSTDFSFLYAEEKKIDDEEVATLTQFISHLHCFFNTDHVEPTISNKAMRELNAEHIFHYPFLENNGFDLDTITPGLQELSLKYKRDQAFKNKISALSEIYLTDGNTLLHGDYYPGSWMKTSNGIRIIDPEFCFFGPAEFDISVMMAHLIISSQPLEYLDVIKANYVYPKGFDEHLLQRFIGIEIMRRIIGLAQLPLVADLEQKEALLENAYERIMNH